MDSHKLRAALIETVLLAKKHVTVSSSSSSTPSSSSSLDFIVNGGAINETPNLSVQLKTNNAIPSLSINPKPSKFIKFKDFYVVSASKINTKNALNLAAGVDFDYGMKDHELSEELAADLHRFMHFMTTPSPRNQEPPIRKATASVYINHAKLFLGWYTKTYTKREQYPVSLNILFPSKTRDGALFAYQFIQFLRDVRKISVSYEANVLRGLTKLAKYVFHEESLSTDTGKSFEDIPCVSELRKLHRQANKKQASTPRSSDEKKKWLTFDELTAVIQSLKIDYEQEIATLWQQFNNNTVSITNHTTATYIIPDQQQQQQQNELKEGLDSSELLRNNPRFIKQLSNSTQRRLAIKLQRYLILAIFAAVPDRQRTIRELAIGTTFVREEAAFSSYGATRALSVGADNDSFSTSSSNSDNGDSDSEGCLRWTIKHGPDDYKTGKSYGDRPPLILPTDLTPAIDDFISVWRPVLNPSGGKTHLFIQPRTGNALTQDSVYQIVARK